MHIIKILLFTRETDLEECHELICRLMKYKRGAPLQPIWGVNPTVRDFACSGTPNLTLSTTWPECHQLWSYSTPALIYPTWFCKLSCVLPWRKNSKGWRKSTAPPGMILEQRARNKPWVYANYAPPLQASRKQKKKKRGILHFLLLLFLEEHQRCSELILGSALKDYILRQDLGDCMWWQEFNQEQSNTKQVL